MVDTNVISEMYHKYEDSLSFKDRQEISRIYNRDKGNIRYFKSYYGDIKGCCVTIRNIDI